MRRTKRSLMQRGDSVHTEADRGIDCRRGMFRNPNTCIESFSFAEAYPGAVNPTIAEISKPSDTP